MKGKKIAALLMAAVLLMAAMTGCSGSGRSSRGAGSGSLRQ